MAAGLLASLIPGLISGFAGSFKKSEGDKQRDYLKAQITKPGFEDFGQDIAQSKGPNLSLSNARRPISFNRGF